MQVFLDLDFTLMEMNPFTLDSEGKPFPLDMRGELDDTAAFKSGKRCVPLAYAIHTRSARTCLSRLVHCQSVAATCTAVAVTGGSKL